MDLGLSAMDRVGKSDKLMHCWWSQSGFSLFIDFDVNNKNIHYCQPYLFRGLRKKRLGITAPDLDVFRRVYLSFISILVIRYFFQHNVEEEECKMTQTEKTLF